MNVTFDPAKDAANVVSHGISLNSAAQLDWETLSVKPDTRRNYGELRMIGLALMASRLYCVVFVDREQSKRIISLRKANAREVAKYAKDVNNT
jgi:uncharacterized protein